MMAILLTKPLITLGVSPNPGLSTWLGRAGEKGFGERWEWLEKLSPIRSKRRHPLHLKGVKRSSKD